MSASTVSALILDLALIGAATILGLKHALPPEAVAGLLGALAGGRLAQSTAGGGLASKVLGAKK